jgi:hypothetical protein
LEFIRFYPLFLLVPEFCLLDGLLFTDWALSFNFALIKTFWTLGFIILDLRPPEAPSIGVMELYFTFMIRPFVAPRERVVLAV